MQKSGNDVPNQGPSWAHFANGRKTAEKRQEKRGGQIEWVNPDPIQLLDSVCNFHSQSSFRDRLHHETPHQ